MNMRERILAVIQGRDHDRVPFVQYHGAAAPNEEVWQLLGRDQVGILRWVRVHELISPDCRFEMEEFEREGHRGYEMTLYTPVGQLTTEKWYEPVYNSAATHKHYITRPEDYRILLTYLRSVQVQRNVDMLSDAIHELADDGLPLVALERTPFQQLWVQWVSLEDLCIDLIDVPELVEPCITELNRIAFDIFEVVRQVAKEAPIPFVDFPDNITAPTIGETKFRQYCLPLYHRLAEMLSDLDVPVFVHMDGDLKPLWSAIAESGVRGLDSFSPQPDNDTSVAEAVARWPQMRLFLNFPSSVHLASPDEVYAQAMKILHEGGHTGRLQIQISENVPPYAWRHSFPAIVRAVNDFGKP